MRSVLENLQDMAVQIESALKTLLMDHSAIYRWNEPSGVFVVISAHRD